MVPWSSTACLQMKGKTDGYDANAEKYCDLVAAGIVDPGQGGSHLADQRRFGCLFVADDRIIGR